MAKMETEMRPEDGLGALLSPDVLSFDEKRHPHLRGGCCRACETRMFPRVEVCPTCMSEDVAEEMMPDHGTLYTYTVVHVGPARWDKPLTLGYIDLSNGVRVFAHLKGKVAIGQQVSLSLGSVGRQPDGQELRNFVFSADVVS